MKTLKDVGIIVALIAGTMEIVKGLREGWHGAGITLAILFFLVGVLGLLSYARRWRRIPNAFALLAEQADLLILQYKDLHSLYPKETQLPLKPSSWPNFGGTWDMVHVRLCRYSAKFEELRIFGSAALQQIGYRSPESWLNKDELTSMVLLLNGLEHFRDEMEKLANVNFAIAMTCPRFPYS